MLSKGADCLYEYQLHCDFGHVVDLSTPTRTKVWGEKISSTRDALIYATNDIEICVHFYKGTKKDLERHEAKRPVIVDKGELEKLCEAENKALAELRRVTRYSRRNK